MAETRLLSGPELLHPTSALRARAMEPWVYALTTSLDSLALTIPSSDQKTPTQAVERTNEGVMNCP